MIRNKRTFSGHDQKPPILPLEVKHWYSQDRIDYVAKTIGFHTTSFSVECT